MKNSLPRKEILNSRQRTPMINTIFNNSSISSNHFQEENVDVAAWIRFLEEQKIRRLFSTLPDCRQQSKTKYSIHSLSMWAFSLCAFRQKSKNALQTTLESLPKDQQEGFSRMLRIETNNLPHSTTVDYALSRIPHEEVNQILLNQFDALIKKKFFYNHPAFSNQCVPHRCRMFAFPWTYCSLKI